MADKSTQTGTQISKKFSRVDSKNGTIHSGHGEKTFLSAGSPLINVIVSLYESLIKMTLRNEAIKTRMLIIADKCDMARKGNSDDKDEIMGEIKSIADNEINDSIERSPETTPPQNKTSLKNKKYSD